MAYKWDDKSVLQLVMRFQENEALWNRNHPDHRNRVKRAAILRSIGRALGTVRSEVERKLKNLSSHYYREKKVYDVRRATVGPDAPEPKWFAYKALHFLQDKYLPRKRKKMQPDGKAETHPVSYTEPINSNEEDSGQLSRAGTPKRTMSRAAAPVESARDEAGVFGEYIALKIRRMEAVTAATVQHRIQNIIYEADMGLYAAAAAGDRRDPPRDTFKRENSSSDEEWRPDPLVS